MCPMNICVQELLSIADIYKQSKNITDSTISNYVFGNGVMMARLRSGADITTKRQQKAIQWFADNWPSNLQWPSHLAAKPKTKAELKAECELALLRKQAIELNSSGILANPKLFCQISGISRDLLRQLVRNYGNGGKFQHKSYPRPIINYNGTPKPTATETALRMLVDSGDNRFTNFIAKRQYIIQFNKQIFQKTKLKQAL